MIISGINLNGYSGGSSGSSKYIVPDGTKFAYSSNFDGSLYDTSNLTDVSFIFGGCSKLTILDLSNLNLCNVINLSSMFYGCTSLTDLNMTNAILPKMDLNDLGLYSCPLTVESLVSVLNALPQLDEGQSFTCTIGSTNLAKLSNEQKTIATNKCWTLA